ncbi:Chitinase-3-like protein 1 [Halotydeus destructor]|nr:Chitinase-3-like protein 1 [Halotydeus destructor]
MDIMKTGDLDCTSYLDLKNVDILTSLKTINPSLKLLVSAGKSRKSDVLSQVSKRKSFRQTLIRSLKSFFVKYSFDGVEINWEYPTAYLGKIDSNRTADKENLGTLLMEMRDHFGNNFTISLLGGSRRWLLSSEPYPCDVIQETVDFVDVVTIGFTGRSDKRAGHVNPLDRIALNKTRVDTKGNLKWPLSWWSGCISPEKVHFRIASTGLIQYLSSDKKEPLAPTDGGRKVPYRDICSHNYSEIWYEGWDSPVAVEGHDWISYDSPKSVQIKMDYVISQNVGGANLFYVAGDDIDGHCGQGKTPLLNAIISRIDSKINLTLDHSPESADEVIETNVTLVASEATIVSKSSSLKTILYLMIVFAILLMFIIIAIIVMRQQRKQYDNNSLEPKYEDVIYRDSDHDRYEMQSYLSLRGNTYDDADTVSVAESDA